MRAAECRWWNLILWQLMTLVEGSFLYMLGEGFDTTFVFLCMLLLYDS
jgi:hypothetical protein